MMCVYIPRPKRPLILDSASGNLNMNLKLEFKPTRFDWLTDFRQKKKKKKLNSPTLMEAAGSKLGHPGRYDYHHFRSCPVI